eukprot:GHVN01063520.1.p1 GENE.GHVN01063520.1~~GHVN01063520.1.p1  ORF type:complete len:819 (-),score=84.47 GHVN01063520.1:332-2788(-)
MVTVKLDPQITAVIDSAVENNHRTLFVIQGGGAPIPFLHKLHNKDKQRRLNPILWCYKAKDDKKKTNTKKKKTEETPFEAFSSTNDIEYVYYKEVARVLGRTYEMAVLQDIEALTPNTLAQIVETVCGGGCIVFVLGNTPLEALDTMKMDFHRGFRENISASRFNRRLARSLAQCAGCVVIDDSWSLILAGHGKKVPVKESRKKEKSPEKHKRSDFDAVLKKTKTAGQQNVLEAFIEDIRELALERKTSIVSLTAARGRGKSAALGLGIACCLLGDVSCVTVTSRSSENAAPLFSFVIAGLEALGFKEIRDYAVEREKKTIVRIELYRRHRQTVQYVSPSDVPKCASTELLVIDEAAAIPTRAVHEILRLATDKTLGHTGMLVYVCSTTSGYEGTGRSLSLKLLANLKKKAGDDCGYSLRETALDEPIRYAKNDAVEEWLNSVLCLGDNALKEVSGMPHPADCELYRVDRDCLFSMHPASEQFLQRIVTVCASSHYRNSPDDLMLLGDSPAQQLFVLAKKMEADSSVPVPLCVVQASTEGLLRGDALQSTVTAGDLIPWTLERNYQEKTFGQLLGMRIVRIATNGDYQRMGYGSRALAILEERCIQTKDRDLQVDGKMLLQKASDISIDVDWLGSSFGATEELVRFWKKLSYRPVYIRQGHNETTGEHTAIVLKPISDAARRLAVFFAAQFKRRANALLPGLKGLSVGLALSLFGDDDSLVEDAVDAVDMRKLEAYVLSLIDHHCVFDTATRLARDYFLGRIGDIELSAVQKGILLAMCLQYKSTERIAKELGLPVGQVLSIFSKTLAAFHRHLKDKE